MSADTDQLPFSNPYRHGFARLAVGVPRNRVADPVFNAAETIRLYREAAAGGAVVVAFPELGLSAYTCDDLFHQAALLEACEVALQAVVDASRDTPAVAIVGLPLRVEHRLFNCAALVAGGRLLGVQPKTYLPNYGEFYEARQFDSGTSAITTAITLCGQDGVPFGSDLIFQARQLPLLKIHVEICEDVWVPIPPSSYAALAGATVLVNLSASNITIGKSGYRHQLVGLHSARCLSAYLYSSAGIGESTTDLAWDGQALIYESGELLAESERFSNASHLISADADLERLSRERMRQGTFGDSVQQHRGALQGFRTVGFDLPLPQAATGLQRRVERFPYVPSNAATRDERCREVFNIQVQSLVQRLEATGIKKVVIGVSGGLDSTHALLVLARAMDRLQLPRAHILGFTMPGFATSGRTLAQSHALMGAIGCTAREIDIRPSCTQMLQDIGHPFHDGRPVYDITFENVQAGERTSHLFRLANFHNGIVAGTGDLSELALGWCTYGVGDHMSHYNVNASVPKTLIKHLVGWVAQQDLLGADGSAVLRAIVETEVSPELVPHGDLADVLQAKSAPGRPAEPASSYQKNSERPDTAQAPAATRADAGDAPAGDTTVPAAAGPSAQPGQKTEDTIGPYELQDFHLYYVLRYGYRPSKVAFLAHTAWGDRTTGTWPDDLPAHNQYTVREIKKHLGTFLWRFFKTSQFKRSCVPNGPKVGSGGSLSPRGDWRAPSDSEAVVWMEELKRVPDEG